MSDNTFYDIDGASSFYPSRKSWHHNDSEMTPLVANEIDERDAYQFISDWASTGEETSCYDDRSSAIKSLIGPEFRSITPNKTSRGAYLLNKNFAHSVPAFLSKKQTILHIHLFIQTVFLLNCGLTK